MHKFTVDLPKKHGRGGQSALRFARLRMEKRHNYVRKVAETAVQLFISNDKPNISGMILAGSADFKTELSQSDMFDPRLQGKIIKLVDVSYGGNFLFCFLKTLLKFIYSEKATKICEISTLLLTVCTVVKSKVEIFAKFCGLLRI